MDFHSYTTLRAQEKRLNGKSPLTRDRMTYYDMLMLQSAYAGDAVSACQASAEQEWEKLHQPYYNVYPSIIPMLTRLNLGFGSHFVCPPMRSLCICFPKDAVNNPLNYDHMGKRLFVRSILMGDALGDDAIVLNAEMGDETDSPALFQAYLCFPRSQDVTVEQALADLFSLVDPTDRDASRIQPLMTECVRLCCTLCLLDNDPSVITPDVFAKDREKYETTLDPKYLEKARRRGKVGWDIGRHIEKIPHYRRPHMFLAWTGPNRKIPKIMPRKGSIIHRKIVEKIPTGFLGASHTVPGDLSCGV